jgi:hypothetical protein
MMNVIHSDSLGQVAAQPEFAGFFRAGSPARWAFGYRAMTTACPADPVSEQWTDAKLGCLNGFFAISVNSPSPSMVNFSCCVGLAPKPARGVTRRVAAQPMRLTARMEARDHARL